MISCQGYPCPCIWLDQPSRESIEELSSTGGNVRYGWGSATSLRNSSGDEPSVTSVRKLLPTSCSFDKFAMTFTAAYYDNLIRLKQISDPGTTTSS
jgi:hypothetical protein